MAPSTPDWETVLQRTQVLLASGRTVAFAAARCRVSRSELEQRLEQAGLPTKGNAAAARLLNTGEVQTLWFPERLGRGDQQPPLAAIIETIESARNSVDIEFRNLTCDEITDAILRVHARPKVEVRVITNKHRAEQGGTRLLRLIEAGVPIRSRNDLFPAFCIVDGNVVIQGVVDWTEASMHAVTGLVSIYRAPSRTYDVTEVFKWSGEDDLARPKLVSRSSSEQEGLASQSSSEHVGLVDADS